MPAVKFIERLDLGENRSFPDENYLIPAIRNQAAKIAEPEHSPDQKGCFFSCSFGGWLVVKNVGNV